MVYILNSGLPLKYNTSVKSHFAMRIIKLSKKLLEIILIDFFINSAYTITVLDCGDYFLITIHDSISNTIGNTHRLLIEQLI